MPYRLIAFDFDGTLADTFSWFSGALDGLADRFRFRKPSPSERQAMRSMHATDILRMLNVPLWKMPAIAAHTRHLMTIERDRLHCFNGVDEMLAAARQQAQTLAVVSSNSLENVRAVLGEANADRFDHFQCGVDLFGKSSKIKKLLKATRTPAGDCLLIGDEIRDVLAARDAGIHSAAVAWGYNTAEALASCRPDLTFDSVESLTAYFASNQTV